MGVPLPTELDTPGWYMFYRNTQYNDRPYILLQTVDLYMYTNYIFIQWLTKIRQNMFQANDE